MKKRKMAKKLTASMAAVCMSLGCLTALTAEVKAADQLDSEWEKIQEVVGRYYGEWTDTSYSGAVTDKMPNTALLGNGDVGITSSGDEFSKTFYVSKSDFWTYGTGNYSDPCPPILIGGITIGRQTGGGEEETDTNLAPSYKTVTASSYHDDFTPDKAVNGDMQQSASGYGWVSKRPQDSEEGGVAGVQDFWLQLEFEEAITIGRYVVKSDGAVRPGYEANNTSDFELQVSDTGEEGTWTAVDTVAGNTESVFDTNLSEPVQTKYVRLFITKSTQETNADNRQNPRARIGQFELYEEAKEQTEEQPEESVSLALNKPIQVSGYIDNPGTPYHSPGEMLVDGDGSTKWCSTPAENADSSAVYWAVIDLGEEKEIARWILKHAQAGGEGANYNTQDFSLQYAAVESPDPANDSDWIDADVVQGNTAAVTDRNLEEPISARYVRLHVTKPEKQGNNAVRLYELELYTEPKDPNTVFHEKQDILNAEIQTQQELAGVPVTMKTWLSSDKNIMVTELTSKGDEDALFQTDVWASDNQKSKKPISAQSDADSVTVTRSTENKAPDDEDSHVSQAALSTKIMGADDVVTGSDNGNGEGSLKFTLKAGETVYIVTSIGGGGRTYHNDGSLWEDAAEPVTEARDLLEEVSDEKSIAGLNDARKAWWKDFWSASYIDFGTEDEKLNKVQKYYYGAQYLLGSASKDGELAPGLYGIWHTTDNASWSSDYHMNYNFIATFYGTYSSNRSDIALTAVDALLSYVEEGQRRASSTEELKRINADFVNQKIEKGDIDPVNGIEGAILFPVGIAPWGMTTDNVYLNEALDAAYNSYVMTQYYDYTMDKEFLAADDYEVYNYFKQAVAFYEAWLEKEDSDHNEDGYEYVLYAGYNEGSWAKNPAVELAALKNTLKHLIQFSEELGLDADKRPDWIDIYEHLGDQPTTEVNGKTVLALGEKQLIGGQWADLPSPIPGDGNAIPLDAVVPGNVYNYFSSPEDLQVVRDTISVFSDRGAWSQINNFPRLFQEAVKSRYDIDTVITKLAQVIDSQMAPNLRINDNTHGIEKTGATEAVNSMMLISEDGITKIFPNWYADKDAKFVNLRARGAFTVSAEYDGEAQEERNVTITSEAGQDMTLVVPWAEGATVKDAEGNIVKTEKGTVENWPDEKTITFETTEGETYTVEKGEAEEEKPSKNTLEYFLNKAKEHQENGDVDGCAESVKNLFTEAIVEGEAVMADESATREDVMSATVKLMKAIQALDMKAADKTDLEMAVELSESIDLSHYVEARQAEFQKALAEAQAVLADGDAMQPEADAAWNVLVDAISGLRLKADKSTLEELLNSVNDLELDKYTEESVAVFSVAFARAEAVMADETLSEDDQKTLDEAVQALSDAKDQLQLKDGADDGDGGDADSGDSGTGDGNDDAGNSGTGDGREPGSSNTDGTDSGADGNTDSRNADDAADAPKTGDETASFALYAVVAAALAAAAAGAAAYKNRRRNRRRF